MTFEDVLQKLNKRGIFLDSLGQIEDGKKWSARVRKKGTTMFGYAANKKLEKAVDEATKNMRDPFNSSDAAFKGATKNPTAKAKRKRVKLKGR